MLSMFRNSASISACCLVRERGERLEDQFRRLLRFLQFVKGDLRKSQTDFANTEEGNAEE